MAQVKKYQAGGSAQPALVNVGGYTFDKSEFMKVMQNQGNLDMFAFNHDLNKQQINDFRDAIQQVDTISEDHPGYQLAKEYLNDLVMSPATKVYQPKVKKDINESDMYIKPFVQKNYGNNLKLWQEDWFTRGTDTERASKFADFLENLDANDIYNNFDFSGSKYQDATAYKQALVDLANDLRNGLTDSDYDKASSLGINLKSWLKGQLSETTDEEPSNTWASQEKALREELKKQGYNESQINQMVATQKRMYDNQKNQLIRQFQEQDMLLNWSNFARDFDTWRNTNQDAQDNRAHKAGIESAEWDKKVEDALANQEFKYVDVHGNPITFKQFAKTQFGFYCGKLMKGEQLNARQFAWFKKLVSGTDYNYIPIGRARSPYQIWVYNKETGDVETHSVFDPSFRGEALVEKQLNELYNKVAKKYNIDKNTFIKYSYMYQQILDKDPTTNIDSFMTGLSSGQTQVQTEPTSDSQVTSSKEGGVLKLQSGGGVMRSLESSWDRIDSDREEYKLQKNKELEAAAKAEGLSVEEYKKRNAYWNEEIKSPEQFNAQDWMRLGALATDVISLGASFAIGGGTMVAAAGGLGSFLLDSTADWTDDNVSFGDALKNTAVNLGLGLVGLIPGGKTASVVSKLAKWGPRLMLILSAAGAAGPVMTSVKKLCDNGIDGLTRQDWSNIVDGMRIISAGAREGRAIHAGRKYITSNGDGSVSVSTKKGKTILLQGDDMKEYLSKKTIAEKNDFLRKKRPKEFAEDDTIAQPFKSKIIPGLWNNSALERVNKGSHRYMTKEEVYQKYGYIPASYEHLYNIANLGPKITNPYYAWATGGTNNRKEARMRRLGLDPNKAAMEKAQETAAQVNQKYPLVVAGKPTTQFQAQRPPKVTVQKPEVSQTQQSQALERIPWVNRENNRNRVIDVEYSEMAPDVIYAGPGTQQRAIMQGKTPSVSETLGEGKHYSPSSDNIIPMPEHSNSTLSSIGYTQNQDGIIFRTINKRTGKSLNNPVKVTGSQAEIRELKGRLEALQKQGKMFKIGGKLIKYLQTGGQVTDPYQWWYDINGWNGVNMNTYLQGSKGKRNDLSVGKLVYPEGMYTNGVSNRYFTMQDAYNTLKQYQESGNLGNDIQNVYDYYFNNLSTPEDKKQYSDNIDAFTSFYNTIIDNLREDPLYKNKPNSTYGSRGYKNWNYFHDILYPSYPTGYNKELSDILGGATYRRVLNSYENDDDLSNRTFSIKLKDAEGNLNGKEESVYIGKDGKLYRVNQSTTPDSQNPQSNNNSNSGKGLLSEIQALPADDFTKRLIAKYNSKSDTNHEFDPSVLLEFKKLYDTIRLNDKTYRNYMKIPLVLEDPEHITASQNDIARLEYDYQKVNNELRNTFEKYANQAANPDMAAAILMEGWKKQLANYSDMYSKRNALIQANQEAATKAQNVNNSYNIQTSNVNRAKQGAYETQRIQAEVMRDMYNHQAHEDIIDWFLKRLYDARGLKDEAFAQKHAANLAYQFSKARLEMAEEYNKDYDSRKTEWLSEDPDNKNKSEADYQKWFKEKRGAYWNQVYNALYNHYTNRFTSDIYESYKNPWQTASGVFTYPELATPGIAGPYSNKKGGTLTFREQFELQNEQLRAKREKQKMDIDSKERLQKDRHFSKTISQVNSEIAKLINKALGV